MSGTVGGRLRTALFAVLALLTTTQIAAQPAVEAAAEVAPLTDAQARDLLLRLLRERTGSDGRQQEAAESAGMLDSFNRQSLALAESLAATREALTEVEQHAARVYDLLTDHERAPALARATGVLLLVLLLGQVAERLGRRLAGGLPERIATTTASGFRARCGLLALRLALAVAGVVVSGVVAWLASFAFFDRYDPLRVYVATWVIAIALTRLAAALAQFALAPGAPGLRLVAMGDAAARALSRWLVTFAGVATFGFLGVSLLALLGLQGDLQRLLRIAVGLLLALLLGGLLWSRRQAGEPGMAQPAAGRPALAAALAQSWHLLALFYVLLAWGVWAMNVLLERSSQADMAALAVLLALLLPLVDRGAGPLLALGFGRTGEGDAARLQHIDEAIERVLGVLRTVVVAASLLALLEAAAGLLRSALADEVGRVVLRASLNIGVSALLAWVVWQMIRLAIERHLPADEDPAALIADEDGQRAPASRAQTLLPLARTALLVVLVSMVVMIALSSLGVDIGPLLAGAGVVGIAVGFGAQKLVQDMISGVFFLVDDAFRVGEYVEAGGMKGTVESISLRSMRLRHHRGPVQTVPYGEVQAVKNHSRDWVILKLELRLPYDTDVEKVRKIIKKVGQCMLEDEEMGPSFLQPLKSQGVYRIEESALIVRMKFTARPNQQWVLRREAFRRVQEALLEAGVRFAHREVTVRLPGPDAERDPRLAAAGAGAAAATAGAGPPPPGDDQR